MTKNTRLIVDTNLWISFLISKNPDPIEFLLLSKKFRAYFPKEDILSLIQILYENSNFIDPTINIKACRDEKDNFLLNLAVDGKADYLITGDKDLLILEKIEITNILTYSNFIQETKHF